MQKGQHYDKKIKKIIFLFDLNQCAGILTPIQVDITLEV